MSPNDSDHTKEVREELYKVDKMFAEVVAGLPVEDIQWAEATIARRLLRIWMKETEKEFTTNERHKLIRLTNRLLDGVEAA